MPRCLRIVRDVLVQVNPLRQRTPCPTTRALGQALIGGLSHRAYVRIVIALRCLLVLGNASAVQAA